MELEDFTGFCYLAGLYPKMLTKAQIEAVFDESMEHINKEDKRLNFSQFKRSLVLLVLMVFKVQKKNRN